MRARWLKPEFFTDKKISAAGPIVALVYQALWCMADDGGTAPADPDTIKSQMFYRWSAVGVPEISGALRHLSDLRRIDCYTVGDDCFARIVSWDKHQQVHKPSKFRYPKKPASVSAPSDETVRKDSGTSAAPLPASPPPRLLDSQTPRYPRKTAAAPTPDEQRVLDHFVACHPRRRWGEKDVKLVRRHLAAGISADMLCDAITGNKHDPWHAEKHKHELSYVLRDVGMISGFAEKAQAVRDAVGSGKDFWDNPALQQAAGGAL